MTECAILPPQLEVVKKVTYVISPPVINIEPLPEVTQSHKSISK